MVPLTDLGWAIARLRTLYGLSIGESAERLGIEVEHLAAIESGQIDPAGLEGIAKLYDLDEDGLRKGMIRPVEGVADATIFLLQGAYQDFDARALEALGRAMRVARMTTAFNATSDEGRKRLRRRLQFVPAAPAGPRPADAARQGYKLARMVRARMNLGGDPIGDMRALLEDQLGIAVMVDDLVGRDLRAVSIIDLHRAAAAAVLALEDPDRQNNPLLARVYLAHELCHILFDPGSPGSVRIALDGPLDGRNSAGGTVDRDALLESRAKGFAAEFLLPMAGVSALLDASAQAPVASLERARGMVARAREHFGTPWEITTRHLENLGFIQERIAESLRDDAQRPPAVLHPTSLSEAAKMTLLFAMAGSSDEAAMPQDPLRHVRAARQAAEATIDARNAEAIAAASEAVERGNEIEATNLLIAHFDDLFHAGEFAAARRALGKIDPHGFPPEVLTGVLMVTRHARSELGQVRVDFFTRVQSALADTWQFGPEVIAAVARRLA